MQFVTSQKYFYPMDYISGVA